MLGFNFVVGTVVIDSEVLKINTFWDSSEKIMIQRWRHTSTHI